MPRPSTAATTPPPGGRSPVGLVTWLTQDEARPRPDGGEDALGDLVRPLRPAGGCGRPRPWRRRARREAQHVHVALYSWSVVTSSSPGANRALRRTVATPCVAYGDGGEASGSAPRKAPRARAGRLQARLQRTLEEGHRVRLQLGPEERPGPPARRGAGAEGAVVRKTTAGSRAQAAASAARGGRPARRFRRPEPSSRARHPPRVAGPTDVGVRTRTRPRTDQPHPMRTQRGHAPDGIEEGSRDERPDRHQADGSVRAVDPTRPSRASGESWVRTSGTRRARWPGRPRPRALRRR